MRQSLISDQNGAGSLAREKLEPAEHRVQADSMSLRRKVALGAVSLIGLLFAVAGMMPTVTAVESLSGRLILELPAWLGIPFIVLVCLATLFIALLLAPAVRPRRELQEARKRAATAQVLLLGVILLMVGLREHLGINIDEVARRLAGLAGQPAAVTVPDAEQPPAVASELVGGLMQGLLLALALIAFGVMAWLYLALLPERGRGMPPPFDAPALQLAVEESLDDLRHLPDARLAIVRCYGLFERVLATADVRRPPWQTVLEFMRTALKVPRLPDADVRTLTGLFEIARFSRHELGPEHRERAWQALMAVKAALEEEERHAPAS
ncbi:MAG TPA: DUF4129 domain-containing protein [Reyranella sp.]|nr:DUF4129 domain-containing protein [Reyranella sp.]